MKIYWQDTETKMNINNIVDNDNEEDNNDGHDKDVLAVTRRRK